MKNYFILIICLLGTLPLLAQTQWQRFAQSVENHHPGILAAKEMLEAKKAESKTGLTPNNPVVSYGYMPGSTEAMGTKQVYSIEQELAFPSTYFVQSKVAGKEAGLSQTEYEVYRQEMLYTAQQKYIEYIYLLKVQNEYKDRYKSASEWVQFYEAKFQKGDATVIEYNKARIQVMAMQSKLLLTQQQIQNVISELKFMNGGKDIDTFVTEYMLEANAPKDSSLSAFRSQNPEMLLWQQNSELSQLKIKGMKHQVMPNLSLGYEGEQSAEGSYRGVRAGISLPLWQDKNKLKQAKLEASYMDQMALAQQAELENKWQQSYYSMQEHKDLLIEYKKVMDSNIKPEHLDKALKLGEISVINYFTELSFYYDTIDSYLELEMTYQMKLAEVNKFTL